MLYIIGFSLLFLDVGPRSLYFWSACYVNA